MLIGHIHIPYIPIIIENINEDSPFLLITNIIERWTVKSDSYNIYTRIAESGTSTSSFLNFTPWVPIYFTINNSYIIGIFSFKISSHYLLFCSAIFITNLSFQFFVLKIIFGIFLRIF